MTGRTDGHILFGTAEGPGSEPVFICNLLPFLVLAGIFHHQFNVMLFTPGIIVKASISCISRNHFRVFSVLLIVGFDGWDEVMNVIAVLRNIYCPDIAAAHSELDVVTRFEDIGVVVVLIVGFDGWDEVMNVIAVLRNIYCPDIAAAHSELDVVTRFEDIGVVVVVILHVHESRIRICF